MEKRIKKMVEKMRHRRILHLQRVLKEVNLLQKNPIPKMS